MYLKPRQLAISMASWKDLESFPKGIHLEHRRKFSLVSLNGMEEPQQWLRVTYGVVRSIWEVSLSRTLKVPPFTRISRSLFGKNSVGSIVDGSNSWSSSEDVSPSPSQMEQRKIGLGFNLEGRFRILFDETCLQSG